MQIGDSFIMVWGVFIWYRVVLLVCLNISLTSDHYITLLCINFKDIQRLCIPITNGYSRIMHCALGQSYSEIILGAFWRFLTNGVAHQIHLTWVQVIIYVMWWRGLFASKILHLQISGSFELLLRESICQNVSQVVLITCGIDVTQSCHTLMG